MKISKLFHWLYAFLMLLPVFFIGGRCLYVTFNKNAKDSYYGETINETQVINITNVDNLEIGQRYRFSNIGNLVSSTSTGAVANNYIVYSNIELITPSNNADFNTDIVDSVKIGFYKSANNTYLSYFVYDINNNNQSYSNGIGAFVIEFTLTNIVYNFNFLSMYESDVMQSFSYNQYSYLDNAFIYSVNSLNDTPLFSWAKTSFLIEPFTYISGLFGIASTNPINTMLSYWLAISIIWLVFDLIMYVPLLVHRWIDKAKLE